MAVKTVAVYDSSESYIKQFLKYVNEKKEQWMEVHGFTDLGSLEIFLERKPVDVLLFSMEELVDEEEDLEDKYEKFIRHKNVGEFIYFGERRNSKSQLRHINKYRSMKKILSELEEILLPKVEFVFDEKESGVLLVGVYDPSNNAKSFEAALALAEGLSAEKETLLLDFERFSSISLYTDLKSYGSISDLIYFYQTNPRKIREEVVEKKTRYHNFDLLAGPEDREDMKEIPEEEWPKFLRTLGVRGGYQAVVVYMEEAFSNLEYFFDHCDQIYLPMHGDKVSTEKEYQLAKFLYSKGRRDLYERINNYYTAIPWDAGFPSSWEEELLWN